MRKHDVRKWLHAILDLLPVILIPVFMIYSHRHDVTEDFEVVTPTPVYYETNEINSVNDLVVGNIYTLIFDRNTDETIGDSFINIDNQYYIIDGQYANYGTGQTPTIIPNIRLHNNFIYLYIELMPNNDTTAYRYEYTNIEIDFIYLSSSNGFDDVRFISQCNRQYVKEYQEVVTTIPHDVMTSFMDRFNNSIDKYFNMGNVFNLNGVYQWFNTNIFSGNAPTIIYSIWNIALYELVMDLLFLLYGLFMWFIDMVERMMDKPFKSIK